MTDLARLVVKLEGDNSRLQKDLDFARNKIENFKKQAEKNKIVPTIDVYTLAKDAARFLKGLATNALNTADQFSVLAQKTGISVEALSQLDYAAKQTGIEDLGGSLAQFNKNISEAGAGSKTQIAAFKSIGIEASNLKNANGTLKSTEDLLTLVADRFSKYADGADKSTVAQELFGKSGVQMIPFLNQGAKGIAALRKEADALGLTLTTETAQAANDFNSALAKVKFASEGLGRQFLTDITPKLKDFAEFMSDPQTLQSLSKFGSAIASSLDVAIRTVTSLTFYIDRLYGLLSSRPPENLIDAIDKIAELEEQILDSKTDEGGFDFLNDLNPREIEEKTKELNKLYQLRNKFFDDQRKQINTPPTPTAGAAGGTDRPQINRVDEGAAKEAASEALKAVKALQDAATSELKAENEKRQSLLERQLEQNLISYRDFYTQKRELEIKSVDQEIASRQAEVSVTTSKSDVTKLEGEIKSLQIKREQIEEETRGNIEKAEKELNEKVLAARADLYEKTGQDAKAAAIKLSEEYDKAIQRLEIEGRTADLAIFVELKGVDAATAKFNELGEKLRKIQEEYVRSQAEIDLAVQTGAKTQLQARGEVNELIDATVAKERELTAEMQMQAELSKNPDFVEQVKEANVEIDRTAALSRDVTDVLRDDVGAAFDSAADSAFDLAANTLLWGEGGSKAAKALARDLLTNVVSAFIQAGAQAVAMYALQQAGIVTTAATATAAAGTVATAQVSANTAVAASAAPAAGLVSLASFGANAVPALAGIAAVLAIVAAFKGFKSGGYTGDIDENKIAGVVHGGEYVVNATATKEYLPMLQAMNDGSFETPASGSRAMAASFGTAEVNFQIVNNAPGVSVTPRGNVLTVEMLPELLEIFDTDQAARATTGRGRNIQATATKLGAQPRAVR